MKYRPLPTSAVNDDGLERRNKAKKEIVELLKSNNFNVNYSVYLLRELCLELETLAGEAILD